MKSKAFEDFPSVKKVLTRFQPTDMLNVVTYQGVDFCCHTESLAFLKTNYLSWLEAVDACLVSRLKVQEEELLILTHGVTLLATHGWERTSTPSFGHVSLEAICSWFLAPLERVGIDCSLVQDEWDDMVEYGKQYFNLVQDDYKVVWWKIFNCDAKQWSNVLGIIEMLSLSSIVQWAS